MKEDGEKEGELCEEVIDHAGRAPAEPPSTTRYCGGPVPMYTRGKTAQGTPGEPVTGSYCATSSSRDNGCTPYEAASGGWRSKLLHNEECIGETGLQFPQIRLHEDLFHRICQAAHRRLRSM
uniref:Uncharacterized protein n=1 Tax=Coccidioides posadasii RMSCC 3488 TaxID=454284 RepID=A0A0J6F4V9_COCPO|nr:hypothetical protein CPAG_00360 [Coccidioides posadasii RMSCC 3488]